MGHVIAVVNQKGGVAKTTTVANLGWALAELGRSCLLVDSDRGSGRSGTSASTKYRSN